MAQHMIQGVFNRVLSRRFNTLCNPSFNTIQRVTRIHKATVTPALAEMRKKLPTLLSSPTAISSLNHPHESHSHYPKSHPQPPQPPQPATQSQRTPHPAPKYSPKKPKYSPAAPSPRRTWPRTPGPPPTAHQARHSSRDRSSSER